MSDTVVLVPLDGSQSALSALPIARRMAELGGGVLEVGAGDSAEAILAAAADRGATLIVMAAHSGDSQPAGAIGEAAQAVLGGAQCPVVLVDPSQAPGGWAPPMSRGCRAKAWGPRSSTTPPTTRKKAA